MNVIKRSKSDSDHLKLTEVMQWKYSSIENDGKKTTVCLVNLKNSLNLSKVIKSNKFPLNRGEYF